MLERCCRLYDLGGKEVVNLADGRRLDDLELMRVLERAREEQEFVDKFCE